MNNLILSEKLNEPNSKEYLKMAACLLSQKNNCIYKYGGFYNDKSGLKLIFTREEGEGILMTMTEIKQMINTTIDEILTTTKEI